MTMMVTCLSTPWGGEDAVLFGISRNDGQLRTQAPLDFEDEEQLHGGGDRH